MNENPQWECRLLLAHGLLTPFPMLSRTMAGVPAAVKTVDAFLRETMGDPGGILRAQEIKTAPLEPEQKLAARVIHEALDDAECICDCEPRKEARAWLMDHGMLYSAKCCFEALGIEYGAAIEALKKRWTKTPTTDGP